MSTTQYTQTLGVLAGAYKGRSVSERALLTHLYFPAEDKVGCRGVNPGHLVDEYSNPKGLGERPTCKACAKKWDRIQADRAAAEKDDLVLVLVGYMNDGTGAIRRV